MKSPSRRNCAFSFVEVVVVIVVTAALVVVLVPWGHSGDLVPARMTETLANARSLQIATQGMTLDRKAGRSDGVNWTAVRSKGGVEKPLSLSVFLGLLVREGYMTKQELRKVLSAPGKMPNIDALRAEEIAFKIFWVGDLSPADQPLLVTVNVNPGEDLQADAQPFGSKGFVVFNKGGSGGVYTRAKDAKSINLFPTGGGGKGAATYRYVVLK
jgi:hypothetical protein